MAKTAAIIDRDFILEHSMPEPMSGCWIWMGSATKYGYGRIKSGGKQTHAHRASYEVFRGEIHGGLVPDHLCRTRMCVNPAHLELVTSQENFLRGDHPSAVARRRGTCPNGHERSAANTTFRKNGNVAYCNACRRGR